MKRRCKRVNIDPKTISLRAIRSGSTLQAGYDGENIDDVMIDTDLGETSRHRTAAMLLRGKRLRADRQLPPECVDVIAYLTERVGIPFRFP